MRAAPDPLPFVQRRRSLRHPSEGTLLYDPVRARVFVGTRTGIAAEVVDLALTTHTIYLAALGLVPAEEAPPGVDLAAEVGTHEDLFPDELRATRTSSFEREAEFVSQRAELPYRQVLTLLLAESAYEVAVGTLEPHAYAAHQAWAQSEHHPAELVDTCVRGFSFAKLHE